MRGKAVPVFISYHRPDEARARTISSYLRDAHGIETYLDVLDPSIQGPQGVTAHILDGLHRCTHLLAVISGTTATSWWVPFEIGVATERDRRIASYQIAAVTLPDYLRVWPVIIDQSGLALFARRYLQDRVVLEEKHLSLSERQRAPIQTAADFHRQLKADLGQR